MCHRRRLSGSSRSFSDVSQRRTFATKAKKAHLTRTQIMASSHIPQLCRHLLCLQAKSSVHGGTQSTVYLHARPTHSFLCLDKAAHTGPGHTQLHRLSHRQTCASCVPLSSSLEVLLSQSTASHAYSSATAVLCLLCMSYSWSRQPG